MNILDILDENPACWIDTLLVEYREPPFLEVINQYDRTPDVFVSYTEIPKLGLNPINSYDTPIGIYAYPLHYVIELKGRVPFGSGRPYVWIFQWNGRGRLLKNATYTQNDLSNDEAKLRQLFAAYVKKTNPQNLNHATSIFDGIASNAYNSANVQTPLGELWNLTRLVSVYNGQGRTSTSLWSWLFVNMGIAGVADVDNQGIIHPNEPTAGVFFNPQAIKILRRYDVRRLPHHDRSTATDDERINQTDYQWGNGITAKPSLLTTLNLSPDEQATMVASNPQTILTMRNPSKKAIDTLLYHHDIDEKIASWLVHRDPRYAARILQNIEFPRQLRTLVTLKHFMTQPIVDEMFSIWSKDGYRLPKLINTLNKIDVKPSTKLVRDIVLQGNYYLFPYYPEILEDTRIKARVYGDAAIAKFALLANYSIENVLPMSVAGIVANAPYTHYISGKNTKLDSDEMQTVRDNVQHQIESNPAIQFNYIFGDRVFDNDPVKSLGIAAGMFLALGGCMLDPRIETHIIEDASNVLGGLTGENFSEMMENPEYVLKRNRLMLFHSMLGPDAKAQALELIQQYQQVAKQHVTGPDQVNNKEFTIEVMRDAGFEETKSFGGPPTFVSPNTRVFVQFPDGLDSSNWNLMSPNGEEILNQGYDHISLAHILNKYRV